MKTLNLVQLFFLVAGVLFIATSCEDQFVDNPQGTVASTVTPSNTVILGATPDANGETFLTTRTLDKDTVYILNQFVRVASGEVLTIEAGTHILGRSGTLAGDPATGIPPGTLIIERGARIEAAGTRTHPIVFTSEATNPAPGDWGGVIILGNASVNIPGGVDQIEGLRTTTTGDNSYGNATPNDADNSGTLQFVRIEYAGNVLVDGDETNGLTLGGVGSGTTMDHIQVSFGSDDGFEWFGGTVNAKYLVANSNIDDDFDTDQGFNGKVQFGISLRDPNNFSTFPTGGFESNGDSDQSTVNLTNATFSNFTVIGPIGPGSTAAVDAAYNSGVLIRDGSRIDLFNSIVVGYPVFQLELEATADFNTEVFVEGTTLVFPTFGPFSAQGTNISILDFVFTPGLNNESNNASSPGAGANSLVEGSGLNANAWNLTTPDFIPVTEKPSDFSNSLLNTFFDTSVDFRGAFGASSEAVEGTEWHLSDWARF